MAQFRHGGKIGDVIYSLPTIKALGGGELFLEVGEGTEFSKNSSAAESLYPLLKTVEYLTDVRIVERGPEEAKNLNMFRVHPRVFGQHLAVTYADMFGVKRIKLRDHWLEAKPYRVAQVIINRSPRTHGNNFPWKAYVMEHKDRAVFIGLPEEHIAFTQTVGYRLPYYPCQDLLDVAQVISGCDLFIGNQSAPLAIAEAMKKSTIVEIGVAGHYAFPI